jgi:hypothetical protein
LAATTDVVVKGATAYRSSGAFRRALRRNLSGWLFASPWIIGFLLWTVGPMLASLVIAFTNWDLITEAKFVGAQNFVAMAADSLVWKSLQVTTVYAVVSVPLQIALGLGLALLAQHQHSLFAFLSHRLLSAVGVVGRGRGVVMALALFDRVRPVQCDARQHRDSRTELAWRPTMGAASLILMSLWGVGAGTNHLSGRAARDPHRSVRSGAKWMVRRAGCASGRSRCR